MKRAVTKQTELNIGATLGTQMFACKYAQLPGDAPLFFCTLHLPRLMLIDLPSVIRHVDRSRNRRSSLAHSNRNVLLLCIEKRCEDWTEAGQQTSLEFRYV